MAFLSPLRSTILHTPIASSSRLTSSFLSNAPHLTRHLSTTLTTLNRKAPSFSRPGPPQLSPAEQKEFEALQAAAATVGATPTETLSSEDLENIELNQHRDLRKGPRKEFDGDVNPRTGERGGPKMDPFKAGDGDWSFGGRVTDF